MLGALHKLNVIHQDKGECAEWRFQYEALYEVCMKLFFNSALIDSALEYATENQEIRQQAN